MEQECKVYFAFWKGKVISMEAILKKLSSRKLWAAIIGVVVGIALAFGVDGDSVTSVAGAVTSLISVVTYIVSEAKVDAAAVTADVATATKDALDTLYNYTVLTDTATEDTETETTSASSEDVTVE